MTPNVRGKMAETLLLDVKVAVDTAIKALKSIEAQTKSLGKTVVVLNQGFELFGKISRSVINPIRDITKAAIEQEKSEKLLADALRARGRYTDALLQKNIDFASSMQKITVFGDEQVLQTQRLLVQYGIEQTKIEGVTKAIADFASAKKVDLFTATELVGKSIISSTNALSRYGLVVEGAANSTQRAESAISAIAKVFGGAAASEAQSFEGRLKVLSNAWQDVIKNVGLYLIKNPLVIKAIQALTDGFVALVPLVQEAGKNFTKMAQIIADKVQIAYATLTKYVNDNKTALLASAASMGAIAAAIGVYTLAVNAATIATVGMTIAGNAFVAVSKAIATAWVIATGPLGLAVIAITAVGAAVYGLVKYWDDVQARMNIFIGFLITEFLEKFATVGTVITEVTRFFSKSTADSLTLAIANLRQYAAEATAQGEEDLARIQEADSLKLEQANFMTETERNILLERLNDKLAHDSARVSSEKAADDKIIANKASFYDTWRGQVTSFKSFQDSTDKERVENMRSTLQTISTLQTSNNRALAIIGKAAAISMATIDGVVAVQRALAAAPPPYNFALAALVGVATAANIAKIAGVGIGFQEGGIVPGNSYYGDRIAANVNSGEMILTREMQNSLFQQINGGGGATQATVINVYVEGMDVSSESFVDKVVKGINEGVELRNLQLRTA